MSKPRNLVCWLQGWVREAPSSKRWIPGSRYSSYTVKLSDDTTLVHSLRNQYIHTYIQFVRRYLFVALYCKVSVCRPKYLIVLTYNHKYIHTFFLKKQKAMIKCSIRYRLGIIQRRLALTPCTRMTREERI